MVNRKLWISSQISEEEVAGIAKKAGISRLMAKVLLNRGFSDEFQIREFLSPELQEMHDPFLLEDLEKAADRILQAVNVGQRITVYGDYDVDGVTSTSIMYSFLSEHGAEVDYYIPDRLEEGYGLSVSAIEKLSQSGTQLIITVDCGITAFEEVAYTLQKGIDIIITDHHECLDKLPNAYAVVNPCRHGNPYPFKELAGVGVAFKLIEGMCRKLGHDSEYLKYLDLVTLGTIADVVPLLDENRIIARFGLKAIENTANVGLKALIDSSGLKEKAINSFSVSFVLAPRINAAGRLGDAGRAVRLFTVKDASEAMSIATDLGEENKLRQDTEQAILEEVINKIEADFDFFNQRVIVISGKSWHHGIIGIVASKVVEKYYRPCILFSEEDGIAKGSGRSIEGFNLFLALKHCESYLQRYGGHELAAGMAIQTEKLDDFRDAINAYATEVMTEEDLVPKLRIDAFVSSSDITMDNVTQLDMLAPFGAGNPGPVFAYNRLKISDMRTVGDNRHLKLKVSCGELSVDAIGFNMGDMAKSCLRGDLLDAAFSLEVNTWNSTSRVQLNLRDIRLDEEVARKNEYLLYLDKYIVFNGLNDYNKVDGFIKVTEIKGLEYYGLTDFPKQVFVPRLLEELVPVRDDLVAVYQHLKVNLHGRTIINNLFSYAGTIAQSYRTCMNYFKLKRCIDILGELKLLTWEPYEANGIIIEMDSAFRGKTNLEASGLYSCLQSLINR